jgi:HEPN domain-containing protein
MVKLSRSILAIAFTILIMLSIATFMSSTTLAQGISETTTTTSPVSNNTKAVNVTIIAITKANVLREILNKSLHLDISGELREEIEKLLKVNLSILGLEDLKEWIYNASKVLGRVASEIREGREFKVGIVLQRYLNGLREALMNRARTLARKYNVPEDELKKKIEEILANATKAHEVNKMYKELVEKLKEVEAKKVKEFAEKAKMYSYNYTERVRGGEVRGLDVAVKHINEAVKILNRTLEKLINANVSTQVIESIKTAIERLKTVKDVLLGVAEEVEEVVKPKPERIREVFNTTLKMLIQKANHSIDELLEELENLREKAANFSDIIAKVDELKTQLLKLKEELKNVKNIGDVEEILDKIGEVRLKVSQLCEKVTMLTNKFIEKIGDKLKDIAKDIIEKAEKKLREVKDLLQNVKDAIQNIVCIQVYPPPPKCVAIENIKKMLPYIENQVKESEQDLTTAKKSFIDGDYAKAMANAQRALAKLTAAESQLRYFMNMLKSLEKEPPQQPPGQQGKGK